MANFFELFDKFREFRGGGRTLNKINSIEQKGKNKCQHIKQFGTLTICVWIFQDFLSFFGLFLSIHLIENEISSLLAVFFVTWRVWVKILIIWKLHELLVNFGEKSFEAVFENSLRLKPTSTEKSVLKFFYVQISIFFLILHIFNIYRKIEFFFCLFFLLV